jgi:hypothetical protein
MLCFMLDLFFSLCDSTACARPTQLNYFASCRRVIWGNLYCQTCWYPILPQNMLGRKTGTSSEIAESCVTKTPFKMTQCAVCRYHYQFYSCFRHTFNILNFTAKYQSINIPKENTIIDRQRYTRSAVTTSMLNYLFSSRIVIPQ